MKNRGVIICLTVLLSAGMLAAPALGSTQKASFTAAQTTTFGMVTLEFYDCTGAAPIVKEITITNTEWKAIQHELKEATQTGDTVQDALTAQLTVFKNHRLITDDITPDTLLLKKTMRYTHLPRHPGRAPIINNSIFNAMCAISFVLDNGTNLVFGLNTFVNLIGFDIVSVHGGNTTDGITTNGIISRSVPAGHYVGAMFGFLGYWLGEKISTGVYTNLTAAGFTIFTAWLPIPLAP
ncbi:MAG: hypothetical protein JXA00_06785 [Candidatus Thermoplasmatota archaeon]|nr:hypothetical protein [Candidatus Thermoplasmatota archaeon]